MRYLSLEHHTAGSTSVFAMVMAGFRHLRERDRVDSLKRRFRAMSSILRREKIFVFKKTLADADFEIKAKVEVDVRVVQRDDFPKIAEKLKKFEIRAQERFEMGHTCIVAEVHDDIVHFKWVAFKESYVGELERKIRISPDSAYVYSGYTVPEYRGLGISPKVMEKTLQHLSEMGIKKVYACVRHNNFPMLRVKQKETFRKIGTITYTRIFKLRLYQHEGETEEDYNELKEMFSR